VLDAVALGAQTRTAPALRIRAAALAPHLRPHGVALDVLPLLADEDGRRLATGTAPAKAAVVLGARRRLAAQLDARQGRWGTAFIQRQVDLLPVRRLERLAADGRRVVLDVDDAIWLDHARDAGGHRLARLKGTARKVRWLAARADVVIAGNDLLAEWLERHAADVRVVPSLVDVDAAPLRRHADVHTVVLGWIGSRTTAPYLHRLVAPLARAADTAKDRRFELVVIGGSAPEVPGVDCRSEAWTLEGELALLARMDVGLMPLPDTPWTRGKCAYKALQYMAAGVPVVCDDVGVSARVVGDGAAGLVPASPDGWTEALLTLAADADLRTRLGAVGRRRVAADFSMSAWAPVVAALLSGPGARTRVSSAA
jgi:glycosyltransferase involved in cell wall biosynthesis